MTLFEIESLTWNLEETARRSPDGEEQGQQSHVPLGCQAHADDCTRWAGLQRGPMRPYGILEKQSAEFTNAEQYANPFRPTGPLLVPKWIIFIKFLIAFLFSSVVLMFLYAEQDVNLP